MDTVIPKYSYIPELNKALVDTFSTDAYRGQVILVDQADGFEWEADTVSDKVHPNASGGRKMAEKWIVALKQLNPHSSQ